MLDRSTYIFDAPIVSAIIAVFGVGVSGTLAYRISVRQSSHRFNELLYQARLACYPQLYSIASVLAKHIRYGTINHNQLHQSIKDIDEWDSQYAVLLSPISVEAIFDLRFHLRSLDHLDVLLTDHQVAELLISMLADVESALKTELGVYSMSDYHNPKLVRDVSEYYSAPNCQDKKL